MVGTGGMIYDLISTRPPVGLVVWKMIPIQRSRVQRFPGLLINMGVFNMESLILKYTKIIYLNTVGVFAYCPTKSQRINSFTFE